MRLIAQQITRRLFNYEEISHTLTEAFPEEQLIPIWQLRLLAKLRRGNKFTAYYDGENFAGLSFTSENSEGVFVLYLAVNEKKRSKGYGSQILQQIIDQASGRPVILDVEEENQRAINAQQRLRRKDFYYRHGFIDTGYVLEEAGERFEILATSTSCDVGVYRQLLRLVSFGFYRPRIVASN